MIAASIRRWAEERPDHPALHFEGQTYSYAALDQTVATWAAWLEGQGVQRGDRVAWLGANTADFICCLLAAWWRGAIFVPLNHRLTAPELQAQLRRSDPTVTAVDPAFIELLGTAATSTDEISLAATGSEPVALIGATDALFVFTSGTTGDAKGVVHTHGGLQHTVENGICAQELTADDVGLTFLPLFHVGGLNILTLPLLSVGATLVLHRAFDPGQVIEAIATHRVTTSVFVPATMQAVLAHPDFAAADFTSVRGVMTGSSVVPAELLDRFNRAGLRAGQVYGATETGPTTIALTFAEADRIGAAGRPCAHAEFRIVDGELRVRGPHVFDRYWNDPAATTAAFDDGWYRTGDAARQDDDGLIWITGRVDDLIISGGENIDPDEVEAALASAPGVDEIAIVGRDDERWGQVPIAFVVPADGEPPTIEALRAHGELRLARFKLPVELHLVDELPRTALGKVQRFALRPGADRS